MNLASRSLISLLCIILCLGVVLAVSGMGISGFMEDDDDGFSFFSDSAIFSIRIPIDQLSARLMLGISIFALFIVYLGGRSDAKRFNDRTLDAGYISIAGFLKTALYRAVFNFPFFALLFLFSIPLFQTNKRCVSSYVRYPNPFIRRY